MHKSEAPTLTLWPDVKRQLHEKLHRLGGLHAQPGDRRLRRGLSPRRLHMRRDARLNVGGQVGPHDGVIEHGDDAGGRPDVRLHPVRGVRLCEIKAGEPRHGDGRLQARIADPRFKLPKTYLVQVEGEPDAASLDALRRGVMLKDGPTRPAKVEAIADPALWPRDPPVRFRKTVADSWLALTITEGRNRQVRRMTAAIGHPTLRLVRWSIGGWTLDGVPPGEWREGVVGRMG